MLVSKCGNPKRGLWIDHRGHGIATETNRWVAVGRWVGWSLLTCRNTGGDWKLINFIIHDLQTGGGSDQITDLEDFHHHGHHGYRYFTINPHCCLFIWNFELEGGGGGGGISNSIKCSVIYATKNGKFKEL